jgi:pimeloyl-ACP methyl ester carboxylesterase
MTFGYNSTLFNKSSTSRLSDWANFLLSKLEDSRTAPEASNRPIILVGHSLGGIVARKAIVLLNNFRDKFKGISVTDCALLFLSTPHSGSAEADYPKFLISVLESAAGLRGEAVVKELQSFNSSSVDDIESFQYMANVPPFECLCEERKTKIRVKGECVVSSGLNWSMNRVFLTHSSLLLRALQDFWARMLLKSMARTITVYANTTPRMIMPSRRL